jgi:mono/diheme cytochrome c family protein
MKKIFLGSLLFLTACTASKIAQPTADQLPLMQQKVPAMTIERAVQGYTVYKGKCAGCHRLHSASEFSAAQWDDILLKMLSKAKVQDDASKTLITDYLHALSK